MLNESKIKILTIQIRRIANKKLNGYDNLDCVEEDIFASMLCLATDMNYNQAVRIYYKIFDLIDAHMSDQELTLILKKCCFV